MERLPVLVIGHNRPEQITRLLAEVEAYSPPRLYFACDGPRQNKLGEQKRVQEVREAMLAHKFGGKRMTLFADSNQGLRDGVVRAIDWFFDHENEGIVLEDDCLPTPAFFQFCETIITRFRDDPRVWGAGGYNPTEIPFQSGTYGFIRIPIIWGWASWANRWQNYDRNLDLYRKTALAGTFEWPSRGVYHALNWKLRANLEAPTTWDYQYSWSMVAAGGLWAMPDKNLIRNTGFGPDSTNTRHDMFRSQEVTGEIRIAHPSQVAVDDQAELLFLRRHLRVYDSELLNRMRDLVRAFRRTFQAMAMRGP